MDAVLRSTFAEVEERPVSQKKNMKKLSRRLSIFSYSQMFNRIIQSWTQMEIWYAHLHTVHMRRNVSVEIAAGSKSLVTLAHELGHVQYQTMNLATYFRYYAISYGDRSSTQKSLGHNDRDDSGKSAITFVGRFQEYFLRYIRFGNAKPQSYQVLLQNIEREFKIKGDI